MKLDRQVLRYTGYFREAVVESRLEHYSIRRLTLFYYIEDHTLSINEHRQVNSGRPQGAFLKRRQVLKDDQSGICIQPRDLIVGENIVILGKNIRIVSCDQYTREFCELNNIP